MNIFNQKGFCRPTNPVNPANSRDKWILCRSTTTHPGKHYWFNRLTGEASWSDVPENGKPQPKDFQITSQPYKFNFQEPSSPPYDTSPHLPNNNMFSFPPHPYQITNYPQPKQTINQSYNQSMNYRLTPPGFGQASFPKYFLDTPLTNDKAQPLYIQTSFNQPIISKDVSFSAMIRKSNDLKRRRDQFTQTINDNSYSVHATSQPLHKRFLYTVNDDCNFFKRSYQDFSETLDIPIKRTRVSYDNDNIKINENYHFNNITKNNFSQNYTHTFEQEPKSNRNIDVWTTTELNEEINRISSKEFDGNTLKIINTKLKVDKETNTELKVQKSMFSPVHEQETNEEEVPLLETREIEPFNQLAKDDLRFRLLEKKSELEQSRNEDGANKDSKRPPESVKKRVTFRDDYLITNVDDDRIVDGFDDGCGYYEDKEPSHEFFSENFEETSYIKLNIARLKNLSTIVVKDVWYIAVDLPSLITDYEFLIKLVNSDTTCTLLIPEQVKRTLDAQCKGSSLGRRDVTLVRHVARDLARRRDKISIQQTLDKKNIDISKNILECCTEKTNRGYYVILITTDAELRRRCKSHDIPTFTIENIKEFVTETDRNKPKSKPKSVAVTRNVPNSNSKENIFLGVDHPQNFLECFKSQNSFTKTTEIDKTQPKDFLYNSVKKTISNKNTALLPKNNDGTVFKIPKISKVTEKRVNLESLVEEKLKKFTPSSEGVEQRFELAKESWLCSFGQIVEDGFTYILQVSEDLDLYDYPPPWTLLQAIKCVKLITEEANVLTRVVVDKLLHIVYDFSVKDFINPNIRFDDFLTIFGLSYLLFEALKEKSEFSNISTETLSNLDEMFASLNDVVSKPDTIFDNKMHTVSIDICTDLVPDEGNKVIKKDEEVLEYLRRHYSQFKNENIILQNDNNVDNNKTCNEKSFKIIRTLGRDVNKITLTSSKNTKTIVMQESIEKLDKNRNENDYDKNDIDTGNIFSSNNKSTAKIVRNISMIPEFEDRLKKKKVYDERNDNDKNRNEKADFVDYKKENFTKTNEFIHENENEKLINDNDTGENDDIDIDDMSVARLSIVMTSDSGIVKSNESLYAQSIVELFLSEITSFFYAVFNFINKGTSIITKGVLSSKRQRKLIKKISIASEGIQGLANRIQSIIEREATGSENSFRILLVKSGVDPDNVKTYRYRQVLTKCLEQIRILSSALDILDAVARNDDVSKTGVTDASANIGTYNIFEQV